MKKILFLLLTITFILVSSACSSNLNLTDEPNEVIAPKTEEPVAEAAEVAPKDEVSEEEMWTYYENATYEETWEGLKINVDGVAVSDIAPGFDEQGNEIVTSAVGVKFKIENITNDQVYTSFPDQALLITSTGEQVKSDLFESENIGGEIHEGVIKDGDVFFYLERGSAKDIVWIKLNWSSSYHDPSGDYTKNLYHDHSIKINLK